MKSILFIGAEPGGASTSRSIVGRAGYLLFAVGSARAGVAFSAGSAPDLIVAGEPAEGPSGEALLRLLRSHAPLRHTPVLALLPARKGELPPGPAAFSETNFGGPSPQAASLEGPARESGLPESLLSGDPPPEGELPDGQPDEIVRMPANPVELIAKVRYLLNEDERRPPARLAIKRPAEVRAGEIQAIGSLCNLSGSGALVETQAAGALDGPVLLRFSLPRVKQILEPRGRVIRRIEREGEPGRIAVEFVEMDPESQEALASFLFMNG